MTTFDDIWAETVGVTVGHQRVSDKHRHKTDPETDQTGRQTDETGPAPAACPVSDTGVGTQTAVGRGFIAGALQFKHLDRWHGSCFLPP